MLMGDDGDGASLSRPILARVQSVGGAKTIGTLGTILTYNFFIIIGFFTWFMTGVVAQFGFQQTALIDAFRGAWDYVIQPLLGTHMTLTFLSYGLEKVAAGDGEDEYTKYNR